MGIKVWDAGMQRADIFLENSGMTGTVIVSTRDGRQFFASRNGGINAGQRILLGMAPGSETDRDAVIARVGELLMNGGIDIR